ncbi:MAG: glycosyltransferase family 2 protein [Acidobacteriota bacterium]
MASVDVLIPTYNRPMALAVTLTGLLSQTFSDFRVIVSDQSEKAAPWEHKEIQAIVRVLEAHGQDVVLLRHLPRRGMAEQREFLLGHVNAQYSLFLDDDLIVEPYVIENMVRAIEEEGCGFVGCAVIGLSYLNDIRPGEQYIEFWEGAVHPERVRPGTGKWQRYRLHNAANLYHVQEQLGVSATDRRKYRVAWTGGCVLYDTTKLRETGGFGFWRQLPAEHCGEDVFAQVRVMERYGGCGIIPSGVYHQELPTTVPDRRVNAPDVLKLDQD